MNQCRAICVSQSCDVFINKPVDMAIAVIPIPHMDWGSKNLPETYKKFKRAVPQILEGKSESIKIAYLVIR